MHGSALMVLTGLLIFGSSVRARPRLSVPASAALEYGQLGNERYFASRNITVLNLGVAPAVAVGPVWIGPHFDYRFGWQNGNGGAPGTYLGGRGWLAGLGLRRWWTKRWYTQVILDVLGTFDFAKNTERAQSAGLRDPIGTRVRFGFQPSRRFPDLTLDLDLGLTRYRQVRIAGDLRSSRTDVFLAGLGLTYRFGERRPTPAAQKLARDMDRWRLGRAMEVVLPSTAFRSKSFELEAEALPTLKAIAEATSTTTGETILVEGHTDNLGDEGMNRKLSLARADSVKRHLIELRLDGEFIETRGFGSSRPIADNDSDEGRTANRRVRILIVPRRRAGPTLVPAPVLEGDDDSSPRGQ